MATGAFTFVLHSHIPWVLHHGRWPHGVDWLNEAAAETYLPLWRALHDRAQDGVPLGVTLGLTPVLCEQLAHPDFQDEFVGYLEQKIAAATEDRTWFTRSGEGALAALASRWERFYRSSLEDFMGPQGPNLVARFRRLEERGTIEIITCGATHGYLPLLSSDRAARGQLRTAVTAHRRHFGKAPRGIWLPECAYRPAGPWTPPPGSPAPAVTRRGVEELLEEQGLRYFFVDAHLVSGGKPLGVYADRFAALHHLMREDRGAESRGERLPYRAYRVGTSQVACFARDAVTAIQVWSGEHGYPGDGHYLDFHKKRFPGGHRYWSVTHPKADLAHKEVYRAEQAERRAPEHAAHFFSLLEGTLRDAAGRQAAPPLVCAMFDTELFGHWWFEGPKFLGAVLDHCARSQGVSAVPAGEMLERQGGLERVSLPEGSWGDGGGHGVWLNEGTRWTWPLVHDAERRFEQLADTAAHGEPDPLLERLLGQAGRELLLLESSDWQFLITTFAARDYAELRVTEHAEDFARLATLAERRVAGGSLTEADETFLTECEKRDAVFPDFDWRGYSGQGAPERVAAR
ncbi:MAG TPA: 1,4-alpha-glucan branching protein domain-containing protein [Candidatus Eisenbacteria bacterium]|nr:1,4-alpha-glucan branching protein domain-containing protein [Candidatus Eisenbacteria bacterium]